MKHMPEALLLALWVVAAATVQAADQVEDKGAPWGRATVSERSYAPQKVVYDVAVAGREGLVSVLDRVSFLNNIYHANPFEASLVVVLHGDEIPLFAVKRYAENKELMERAHSLTLAGPIEFRMCRVAAESRGLKPADIHGFVQMVPMADAELVKLQREEDYAYMQ